MKRDCRCAFFHRRSSFFHRLHMRLDRFGPCSRFLADRNWLGIGSGIVHLLRFGFLFRLLNRLSRLVDRIFTGLDKFRRLFNRLLSRLFSRLLSNLLNLLMVLLTLLATVRNSPYT